MRKAIAMMKGFQGWQRDGAVSLTTHQGADEGRRDLIFCKTQISTQAAVHSLLQLKEG